MIQFMGSDETIEILEWIREKPFTRSELASRLAETGYRDPFAGISSQSPLNRIIGAIRRSGYASFSGRTWTPNLAAIDAAIATNLRSPVQSAGDSYREIMGKASQIAGGPVDTALVDEAGRLWVEERRASRNPK